MLKSDLLKLPDGVYDLFIRHGNYTSPDKLTVTKQGGHEGATYLFTSRNRQVTFATERVTLDGNIKLIGAAGSSGVTVYGEVGVEHLEFLPRGSFSKFDLRATWLQYYSTVMRWEIS